MRSNNNSNRGGGRQQQQQSSKQQQGGRGGGRQQQQQQQKESPPYYISNDDPNADQNGDNRTMLVGSGWPVLKKADGSFPKRKDGSDIVGAVNLVIRVNDCVVEQDKQGNDVVRLTVWPRQGAFIPGIQE